MTGGTARKKHLEAERSCGSDPMHRGSERASSDKHAGTAYERMNKVRRPECESKHDKEYAEIELGH